MRSFRCPFLWASWRNGERLMADRAVRSASVFRCNICSFICAIHIARTERLRIALRYYANLNAAVPEKAGVTARSSFRNGGDSQRRIEANQQVCLHVGKTAHTRIKCPSFRESE